MRLPVGYDLIVAKVACSRSFWRADVKIFVSFFSFSYIDGPNNIVSLVKQYCFTCQTQVFHFPNNIVSSVKVKYSEDETLVLGFEDNNLMIFTSGLYEKAHFCELLFCIPYTVYSYSSARDSEECPIFGSSVSPICSNVYLAKRLRMPFPVTNSYFGSRKALLRRFV